MIFSSYAFIFIFFPVAFAGYRLTARFMGVTASKVWLVAASLWFYAQGNIVFLPLLAGTMLINYGIVYLLDRHPKGSFTARPLLAFAIAENLGLLFYFKYMNFFIGNLNRFFGTEIALKSIILPLGISFYTFLILTYVVEVYRGSSKKGSFLDYAVFVTFFPHLIVGPIVHHDDLVGQLHKEDFSKVIGKNIMLGILMFSIGCAKKILIADPLITHAQHFYNVMGNGNFFEAWGGVFSYTFAYYFDFSGYTDMALGLALFFNIKLPVNFDSPYKSRNFADFWRRWNITISQFFYDYIFKNIFHFGNRLGKLILAVMATFLVSGLWHGAGWHFIFWGIANGILVCAANIMTLKRKKLPFALAWALTFLFILITRVLFDSNSMTQAISVYKSLLDIRPLFENAGAFIHLGISYIKSNFTVALLTLAGAAICFFAPNTRQISERFQPKWYYAVFSGALLTASLFYMGTVSNFLYFAF